MGARFMDALCYKYPHGVENDENDAYTLVLPTQWHTVEGGHHVS